MTTKTEFNNVNEEVLDKILDKYKYQLSQDDLLTISAQLKHVFIYNHHNPNRQESLINQCLNIITDTRYFKPYDQRSLVEFTLQYILEWLDENENSDLELSADNVLRSYFEDRTLTYNRQKSINYIHSFWDEFIESDVLSVEHTEMFKNPEEFLKP